VVAALFVVIFSISNPTAAFGVFLPVLADTFGWSRGAIAVALSINLLLGGLASFAIGAIADRYGPRGVLLLTAGLAGSGLALASTLDTLWHLYVFIGLMGGVGGGAFFVVGTTTVTRWFDRNRGLPLAIVLTGFNLAFLTGGPVAAWLIGRLGWRPAYLVLGGSVCLIGLAAIVVKNPPTRPAGGGAGGTSALTQGFSLRDALADRRLWLITLSLVLGGAVYLMVPVHVVAYARDHGIGLASASLALTAYGIGATVGRLASGPMSDRLGGRPLMGAFVALQIVTLAALPFGLSQEALMVTLALFGVGGSGSDTVLLRLIPDVFGLKALGAIMGVMTLGWRLGAAVGPAAAGFVHDLTGSYVLPFASAPVLVLAYYVLFLAGTAPRAPR
jgi:MFS family permease